MPMAAAGAKHRHARPEQRPDSHPDRCIHGYHVVLAVGNGRCIRQHSSGKRRHLVYQYYPIVSREEYGKSTVRGAISKYFNNSYLSVVSSLVKEEDISLDELKELIRQVEEGNK